VQVHDVYEYDINFFNKAKCIIFTHPVQYFLWRTKGFIGNYKIIPIGSRKNIPINYKKPDIPTVGFYCKETKNMEKGSQLFKDVILRTKREIEFNVLMIGENLKHIQELGQYEERAANIYDYSKIDVLFTSSVSPAVPLSIYEALSIGKPIISTPRWFTFSSTLIHQGYNEIELTINLVKVINNRNYYYDNRHDFKISPFFLEDWIEENIKTCYE
jgi:glycosyltransferase involved in cell wall biosynthesis